MICTSPATQPCFPLIMQQTTFYIQGKNIELKKIWINTFVLFSTEVLHVNNNTPENLVSRRSDLWNL